MTTTAIKLRPYQVQAVQALIAARKRGDRRALVHLATGLGKTVLAASDALHYRHSEKPGSRILFVSHMNDISQQAMETFKRINPGATMKQYISGEPLDAPIMFATFQSLHLNLATLGPHYFDYIVYDEAHHIEATTFKRVREHFKPQFELGLTATPTRADGLDILDYFGEPVYAKGLAEGIAEGWLSAVDYHIVLDDAVKKAVKEGFDAKSRDEIRALFSIRVRNAEIAREVRDRRHAIGMDDAKTIVFCHNREAAEQMAHLLGGRAYHSGIFAETRREIMQDFRDGTLQVICTVSMFNEGVDIPDARLVVFLRSTSSRTIFEQQLGRGLRRAEGKDSVTVLDFVANVERIDFVQQLGHAIKEIRERLGRKAERKIGPGAFQAAVGEADLAQSDFIFEDSTVELLSKYKQLSGPPPPGYLTTDQLAELVNRKPGTLRVFASVHQLKLESYYTSDSRTAVFHWSPEQIEYTRNILQEADRQDRIPLGRAAALIGHHYSAIKPVAKKLGITPKQKMLRNHKEAESLTLAEAERIKQYFDNFVPPGYLSVSEISEKHQLTRLQIMSRVRGISPALHPLMFLAKAYYSPEQIGQIINYKMKHNIVSHQAYMEAWTKYKNVAQVATKLGTSNVSVYKHLRREGINLMEQRLGMDKDEELQLLPPAYCSTKEIAGKFDLSIATVQQLPKRMSLDVKKFRVPGQAMPTLGFSPTQVDHIRQHYATHGKRITS